MPIPQAVLSRASNIVRNTAMLDRWAQEGFKDSPYHTIAFAARQPPPSCGGKPMDGNKSLL